MISDQWAAKQVSRLSVLDYFPQYKEGVQELMRALARVARDEAHASRVIDSVVERFEACPKPSDIARIAGELSTSPEPRESCVHCGGSGFVIIHGPKGDGARPCSCWAVRGAA